MQQKAMDELPKDARLEVKAKLKEEIQPQQRTKIVLEAKQSGKSQQKAIYVTEGCIKIFHTPKTPESIGNSRCFSVLLKVLFWDRWSYS